MPLTAPERAARNAARRALGLRLRSLRHAARLSSRALGAALGVAQSTILYWEGGSAAPDGGQLLALARLLGLTPGEVLDPVARALAEEPRKGRQ